MRFHGRLRPQDRVQFDRLVGGRYAYGNQPSVATWNLARFAEALLGLIDEDQDRAVELATESLQQFAPQYSSAWLAGMRRKLGLGDEVEDATAGQLTDDLVELLEGEHVDYTSFFRRLADGVIEPPFEAWATRWRA